MHHEPTPLDCEPQAGAIIGRCFAISVLKRCVDHLDVDAAVLSSPNPTHISLSGCTDKSYLPFGRTSGLLS
jgi:hypothetical protein